MRRCCKDFADFDDTAAPEEPKVLDTLPAKSNVLAVGVEELEGEGR